MRAKVFFTILTMLSSAALAQQPAAQGAAPAAKLFAGSADVTAMMAKAKSERKPDQAPEQKQEEAKSEGTKANG